MSFENVQDLRQSFGSHAEQQASARLGIGHQCLCCIRHFIPFRKLIGKAEIIPTPAWYAVLGDQR